MAGFAAEGLHARNPPGQLGMECVCSWLSFYPCILFHSMFLASVGGCWGRPLQASMPETHLGRWTLSVFAPCCHFFPQMQFLSLVLALGGRWWSRSQQACSPETHRGSWAQVCVSLAVLSTHAVPLYGSSVSWWVVGWAATGSHARNPPKQLGTEFVCPWL